MAESKTQSKSDAPKVERKFPTEIIDLPSGGKLYPEGHPCRDGKIEVKYMTAKEEDILTSQNLIKKGIVIDTLLTSLIATEGVDVNDLFLGDKNAIMIAVRILAYGPEYSVTLTKPDSEERFEHTFDLSSIDYKLLPSDVEFKQNEFEFSLPASKDTVTFKLLTGRDEKKIDDELKSMQKLGVGTTREITTRLKHLIVSVNGSTEPKIVYNYVQNMLSRDSLALRQRVNDITPDIDLRQEVEIEGEAVTVDIPMTADFFWPTSRAS